MKIFFLCNILTFCILYIKYVSPLKKQPKKLSETISNYFLIRKYIKSFLFKNILKMRLPTLCSIVKISKLPCLF